MLWNVEKKFGMWYLVVYRPDTAERLAGGGTECLLYEQPVLVRDILACTVLRDN